MVVVLDGREFFFVRVALEKGNSSGRGKEQFLLLLLSSKGTGCSSFFFHVLSFSSTISVSLPAFVVSSVCKFHLDSLSPSLFLLRLTLSLSFFAHNCHHCHCHFLLIPLPHTLFPCIGLKQYTPAMTPSNVHFHSFSSFIHSFYLYLVAAPSLIVSANNKQTFFSFLLELDLSYQTHCNSLVVSLRKKTCTTTACFFQPSIQSSDIHQVYLSNCGRRLNPK